MATFAHPPSAPGNTTLVGSNMAPPAGAQPPVVKPQLRRAVYVHVSDLLSAYNIDHTKLEEELQRVKKAQQASSSEPAPLGVPTELDTNPNPKKLQPPRGGFNLCAYVVVVCFCRLCVVWKLLEGFLCSVRERVVVL